MSRSIPWRWTVSDLVSWRQDQAQNATIFILREMGPTGFLLKEEGSTKKVKVYLGDPHTCTCLDYKKDKDLCKHICWVLLKKFRIPREDQLSFQFGLIEREINELLRGRTRQEQKNRVQARPKSTINDTLEESGDGKQVLEQRQITEDDVCPICQDELLGTREPVTYCRYGCAKSIHIKCMKVWADHQKTTGEMTIKCPLCREDFGEIEFLQKELRNASLQKTKAERGIIHMGMVCVQCNQSPIAGRCYKCTECNNYHLCQTCFTANFHRDHSFQFRQKPNQRWRPAQRSSGGALPQAVLADMQNRELQEEDYELLLQLDSQAANQPSAIPESVIKSFPTERVRQGGALTAPGVQCRVCLRGYVEGQTAKRLPCKHKFHSECIEQWLLHEHPTCPVDGTVVWNPITAQLEQEERRKKKAAKSQQNLDTNSLEIPALGVARQRLMDGQRSRHPLQKRGGVRNNISQPEERLAATFELMGLGISSHVPANRDIVNPPLSSKSKAYSRSSHISKTPKQHQSSIANRHPYFFNEDLNTEGICIHSESMPVWTDNTGANTTNGHIINAAEEMFTSNERSHANEERSYAIEESSHANEERSYANEERSYVNEDRLYANEDSSYANEERKNKNPQTEAEEARQLRDYSLFNIQRDVEHLSQENENNEDFIFDVTIGRRNEITQNIRNIESAGNNDSIEVESLLQTEREYQGLHDEISQDINMNIQEIHYRESSSQGLRHKPPMGVKPQKRRPGKSLSKQPTHVASIPTRSKDVELSTVGHRAEGTKSAPSSINHDGEDGLRGSQHKARSRRRQLQAGRRKQSQSPGRTTSATGSLANKQEMLENMFLGSSTGKLLSTGKRGSSRRHTGRASSLPLHRDSREVQLMLSGNQFAHMSD